MTKEWYHPVQSSLTRPPHPGKIVFGSDPLHPACSLQPLLNMLRGARINVDYQPDPLPAIWMKFLFIASFGLVSARHNQPIGVINEDPDLHDSARRLVLEITAIAQGKGVALPENSTGLILQKAASFPYHTPTSLQLDVHSDKPCTELELFAGSVTNYGHRLGLSVVETTKICQGMKSQLVWRAVRQDPIVDANPAAPDVPDVGRT